jgi:hypothetical protein
MPRYTLTISPDYVKDWSVSDAIRELIQNAIDQESLDNTNTKTIEVVNDSILIANKNSVLEKSTLLLGGGTKDGSSTIGQFGEGYKVSLLVLLREGYDVEIRNYKAGELWIPKIVNSRIYNSQVLAIDTMEYKFETIPDNSLEITINGMDCYTATDLISEVWLDYNSDYESVRSGKADILLDESLKGNIYVRGLKITHNDSLHYGYNFDVNVLKLGRDRNIVSGYELQTELGHVWGNIDSEYTHLVLKMFEEKAYDVVYCSEWKMATPIKEAIVEAYKDKTVITYESDKDKLRDTFGEVKDAVIVPEAIRDVVYCNHSRTTGVRIEKKSTRDLFNEFLEKYEDYINTLDSDFCEELEDLINLT